ncbi:MAG: OpgC domain-containing protein [Candidatus Microsaccharimonas sp.]
MSKVRPSSRILALDYLRGFFIFVIIIDHLNRWPSLFGYISGMDSQWVSAAEGFVIVSGLLIGYIRGFKSKSIPMREVTKKLWSRALLLYVWAVITSLILIWVTWYVTFQGSTAHVPIEKGNWLQAFWEVATLQYTHLLTHFLGLYAVFLFAAPLAVFLLRKSKAWVLGLLSITLWWIGTLISNEMLQWQVLFFLAAIGGYYLESIQNWLHSLSRQRRFILYGVLVATTIITAVFSVLDIFDVSSWNGRAPLGYGRILLAGVWFCGFLIVFTWALPWIQRWFGWLLGVFGTRSLSAYILHAVPAMIISICIQPTTNFWVNSLIGLFAVLSVWGMLKLPIIQRLLPR